MTVYFDSILRTRRGPIPFYEITKVEAAQDNQLCWFHTGYGLMRLYRLLQVDNNNFIAEDMHTCCRTNNPDWPAYQKNPELVLGNT